MPGDFSAGWLRDLYGRFEAEVKLLYAVEPFWRVCRKCPDGNCCAKATHSVEMSKGNPFLLEDWAQMLEYVRDVYSKAQKDKLVRNILSDSKNCIFLVDNRCSIHPARPWSCRTHPYTVSFYPRADLFPAGELALPSCPALSASFGIKIDEMLVQPVSVIERYPGSNLVKVKLKKHKPVWLIDATSYIKELEDKIPPEGRPAADWPALFSLAEEAVGAQGAIAARYVEKVTARIL